jgi:hypothetical protein
VNFILFPPKSVDLLRDSSDITCRYITYDSRVAAEKPKGKQKLKRTSPILCLSVWAYMLVCILTGYKVREQNTQSAYFLSGLSLASKFVVSTSTMETSSLRALLVAGIAS